VSDNINTVAVFIIYEFVIVIILERKQYVLIYFHNHGCGAKALMIGLPTVPNAQTNPAIKG
jgi:hypothetical protein